VIANICRTNNMPEDPGPARPARNPREGNSAEAKAASQQRAGSCGNRTINRFHQRQVAGHIQLLVTSSPSCLSGTAAIRRSITGREDLVLAFEVAQVAARFVGAFGCGRPHFHVAISAAFWPRGGFDLGVSLQRSKRELIQALGLAPKRASMCRQFFLQAFSIWVGL